MKTLGVIDIGSNSVRLLIVSVDKEGFFTTIDELKQSVRLGQDMSDDGDLNLDKIDTVIDVLRFFKSLCISFDVDSIIAVATAAVRSASNKNLLLDRLKSELNIDMRIISGLEEAYYSYFGTINNMDVNNCLLMDIGGCSTELILVNDRKVVNSISLPIGAINLTDDFNLSDDINKKIENSLNSFLVNKFNSIPWLLDAQNYPLVGIGGTFRNIGKIDRKKKKYPLDISHNYKLSAEDLHLIYDEVKTKSTKDRRKIKGLAKDRADIFLAPLSVINCLSNYCNVSDIYISGSGLREGIVFEYTLKSLNPIKDVLDYSLNNILNKHNLNKNHSAHVWNLSSHLFKELSAVHNLSNTFDDVDIFKVLKTASYLHDIGVNVNYYEHHHHSFYIMLNSNIKGLSHKEIIIASYVAASHRKDEFKVDISYCGSLLTSDDMNMIRKLGVILQIAEILDRRMDGSIESLACEIKKDTVSMNLISQINYELEINSLHSISSNFKEVMGKNLTVL